MQKVRGGELTVVPLVVCTGQLSLLRGGEGLLLVLSPPPLAAAAAADLGVDEAEDVGQHVADVRQAQQHEGDAQDGVGDTHQAAPHRLGGDVTITCNKAMSVSPRPTRRPHTGTHKVALHWHTADGPTLIYTPGGHTLTHNRRSHIDLYTRQPHTDTQQTVPH